MTARKLAETDAQIQTLKRHVSEECVAIASSLDTIPPGLVSREMRDRWLRTLRQATRAPWRWSRSGSAPTPRWRPRLGEHERGSGWREYLK